jgi:hypothetical protein
MNIKQARAAIEAILAAIPDSELPKFDKVEERDGKTIVWWGGTGHHLGTARHGEERDPSIHRRAGSWDAIEAEMTYRADVRFLENGDSADGIKISAKRSKP